MDGIAFDEKDRMKNSVLHPVAEGDPTYHIFRQNRTCRPYRDDCKSRKVYHFPVWSAVACHRFHRGRLAGPIHSSL